MRFALFFAIFCISWPAYSAPPEITRITYPIEGNRSAVGKAVAIGPNLWLSADHVIRDDQSSLGTVLAVDRKYDRCLIQGPSTSWSEVRREPVRPGETLYFEGGTVRVQPDLSFQVTSGRAISGMSGGPIYDSQGRIVSVVSEGEGNGDGRLWGYLGLAEWVDSVVTDRSPTVEAPPIQVDYVACLDGNGLALNAPPVQAFGDTQSLVTPRLRVYTAPGCAPCEAFKQTSLPLLEAKGWEVGRNIEFVDAGNIPAPRFEWVTSAGVASVLTGYTGRDAFNNWHAAAINGGVKSEANGCQCGPDCPCVAGVSSGPRERVPNPDFVMTELVEPSAVFTEYDEPQGIIDGGVQFRSTPAMGCVNGQCQPVQAGQHEQGYWTPPQQQSGHQSHGYRGPVRRVLGLFGGCFGGGCR